MNQQEFSLPEGGSLLIPEQTRSVGASPPYAFFFVVVVVDASTPSDAEFSAQLPVAEAAGDRRLARLPKPRAEATLNFPNVRRSRPKKDLQTLETFGSSDRRRHVGKYKTALIRDWRSAFFIS